MLNACYKLEISFLHILKHNTQTVKHFSEQFIFHQNMCQLDTILEPLDNVDMEEKIILPGAVRQ